MKNFIKKIFILALIIQITLVISRVYHQKENKETLYGVARASYYLGCVGFPREVKDSEANVWIFQKCLDKTNRINIKLLVDEITLVEKRKK